MGKLIERLQDASRSGVYRAARVDEISDALRGRDFLVVHVEFASKDLLLKNLAQALAFPEWFGHNWDALEDCLTDLSWHEAPGYVLLFEHAEPGDELGVLLDILRSAAESWAARGRPFFAVFLDPSRRIALPDLFKQQ